MVRFQLLARATHLSGLPLIVCFSVPLFTHACGMGSFLIGLARFTVCPDTVFLCTTASSVKNTRTNSQRLLAVCDFHP